MCAGGAGSKVIRAKHFGPSVETTGLMSGEVCFRAILFQLFKTASCDKPPLETTSENGPKSK